MHRLIRNIGWLLTGRGVNAVLSIVYLALATRTLGLDHFGYFAIILALGQTVTATERVAQRCSRAATKANLLRPDRPDPSPCTRY